MKFDYKPVKTYDDEGNRFVLDIDDEDGSVFYFDNHKRDGYGLVAGRDCKFTNGEVYNEENFKELFRKLNELYLENQALKNNDGYHQMVMSKFDKWIHEFEKLALISLESKDNDTFRYYNDVGSTLEDIKQHTFQGEEYE